jgi:hypothetical protein
VPLEPGRPRFVYGNADEGGFFRPLHSETELAALLGSLASLSPVERMGLVDHQWALVRAGRTGIASLLDLVVALAEEPDPDVLTALHKPLAFLADGLVPDAAADCWPSTSARPSTKSAGSVAGGRATTPACDAPPCSPSPEASPGARICSRRLRTAVTVTSRSAAPSTRTSLTAS